jgi:hypothetical protein
MFLDLIKKGENSVMNINLGEMGNKKHEMSKPFTGL